MADTSSSEDDMSRSSRLGTSRRSSRKTARSFRLLQLGCKRLIKNIKLRTRQSNPPLYPPHSWLEDHSKGVSERCRRHGRPFQSGVHGAPRGPEKSYTESSHDQEAWVGKVAHGFFLGPICKAPEHVRFLVADNTEPTLSAVVEAIDIEATRAACQWQWGVVVEKRRQSSE